MGHDEVILQALPAVSEQQYKIRRQVHVQVRVGIQIPIPVVKKKKKTAATANRYTSKGEPESGPSRSERGLRDTFASVWGSFPAVVEMRQRLLQPAPSGERIRHLSSWNYVKCAVAAGYTYVVHAREEHHIPPAEALHGTSVQARNHTRMRHGYCRHRYAER